MERDIMRRVVPGILVMGLSLCGPAAWAELEVADHETVTREVTEQVERLITEAETRDPELARELERQQEICVRDLSDGRLDDAGLVKEVETSREVQQEVAERIVQSELQTQLAKAVEQGNTELAEKMQLAFSAVVGPGEAWVSGTESVSRGEARTMFEQAYQEAQRIDPEGAQHMKDMFESAERGEFMRPSPEMMERMHDEMERYMAERPEMADHALAEWDRMIESGPDTGDRYGSTDSPEQARDSFERWASESGRDAAEVEHYREMMEHEMTSVEREMTQVDREQAAEREWATRESTDERDTSAILDHNIEIMAPPPGGGGGGGSPHVEVSPGQWDGSDTDALPDHTHPAGTAPHSG